jgi:hypothetical protein
MAQARGAAKAEAVKAEAQFLRAKPATITSDGQSTTTVEVRSSDFAENGISHSSVTFNNWVDDCSVKVGDGPNEISKEAADFLANNYPNSFEYSSGI